MTLDEFLARITSERIRQVVEELVADRPPEQRLGAVVGLIVQRLLAEGGAGLPNAYWPVRDRIRVCVEASTGLRYLESPG